MVMVTTRNAIATLLVLALGIAVTQIPGTLIHGGVPHGRGHRGLDRRIYEGEHDRSGSGSGSGSRAGVGTGESSSPSGSDRDADEDGEGGARGDTLSPHIQSHANADFSEIADRWQGHGHTHSRSNTRAGPLDGVAVDAGEGEGEGEQDAEDHVDSCSNPGPIQPRFGEACVELRQIYGEISAIHVEIHKSYERRRSVNKRKSLHLGCDVLREVTSALRDYVELDLAEGVAIGLEGDDGGGGGGRSDAGDGGGAHNKGKRSQSICKTCMTTAIGQGDADCLSAVTATQASAACEAIIDLNQRVSSAIGVFEGNMYLKAKYKGGVDALQVLYNSSVKLKNLFTLLDCVWCFNKDLQSL